LRGVGISLALGLEIPRVQSWLRLERIMINGFTTGREYVPAVDAAAEPRQLGRDPQGTRGRPGAIKCVADRLGVHPEALQGWVKQAEPSTVVRWPGTMPEDPGPDLQAGA